MRFSENQNYLAQAKHVVRQEYPAARLAIEACLSDPSITPLQTAFLLQRIGLTYFLENNVEQSLQYYEMAEKTAEADLMVYLFTAKFFAERLKDYERAITKCDEIIRLATSFPTEKTEDDLGSAYYIAKAEELKQFCLSQKAGENI